MLGDRLTPDDGVVAGAESDDSPWRPGADVHFDHPPSAAFSRPVDGRPADAGVRASTSQNGSPGPDEALADGTGGEPPMRGAPPGRRVAIAGVVVAVLGVGAGAAVVTSSPSLSGSALAAATPAGDVVIVRDVPVRAGEPALGRTDRVAVGAPRLPASVSERWTADLGVGAEEPQIAFGQTVVVVAIADGSGPALVGLDLADGAERWRFATIDQRDEVELRGVTGGTAIVEVTSEDGSKRLVALDETDGTSLWDVDLPADDVGFVDPRIDAVFVQRPPTGSRPGSVSVLAPERGDEMTRAAGEFLDIVDATWLMTRAGDKVLANSLTPDSGTPYTDMIGAVPADGSPFTLAGRTLIAAPSAETLTRSQAVVDANVDRVTRELDLLVGAMMTSPSSITGLGPLSDSSVVASNGTVVYGVGIEGTIAEVRWQVLGVVVADAISDRGRTLVTATEGGAAQRVIDGATGRTIVDIAMRPGAIPTLELAANGVIVQGRRNGSVVRRAVDLDGEEMWTLPGSGRLEVGDGVIVDLVGSAQDEAGWRIVAYRDA